MVHFERDYLASVESMNLNESYASVLFDGKLQLHAVSVFLQLRSLNNVHVIMNYVSSDQR